MEAMRSRRGVQKGVVGEAERQQFKNPPLWDLIGLKKHYVERKGKTVMAPQGRLIPSQKLLVGFLEIVVQILWNLHLLQVVLPYFLFSSTTTQLIREL